MMFSNLRFHKSGLRAHYRVFTQRQSTAPTRQGQRFNPVRAYHVVNAGVAICRASCAMTAEISSASIKSTGCLAFTSKNSG